MKIILCIFKKIYFSIKWKQKSLKSILWLLGNSIKDRKTPNLKKSHLMVFELHINLLHYRVCPPFAAMTAWHLDLIEPAYCWISLWLIYQPTLGWWLDINTRFHQVPKMLNWIEIRTFCRHVDKTNADGCQQVLSGPGCMTRDIVRNALILYRGSRGYAESGAVEGHQLDISERSGYPEWTQLAFFLCVACYVHCVWGLFCVYASNKNMARLCLNSG